MQVLVDIPEKMYHELLTWKFSTEVSYRAINAITKGKIIPNDAKILTAEEYSDLCLRSNNQNTSLRKSILLQISQSYPIQLLCRSLCFLLNILMKTLCFLTGGHKYKEENLTSTEVGNECIITNTCIKCGNIHEVDRLNMDKVYHGYKLMEHMYDGIDNVGSNKDAVKLNYVEKSK